MYAAVRTILEGRPNGPPLASDGSFKMYSATPSGRRIWVIWRYDREEDDVPDVFAELEEPPIFVITGY